MTLSIDLNDLSALNRQDLLKLAAFLEKEARSGTKTWQKNVSYAFEDGIVFNLKQDLMFRPRKAGKTGARYQVISDALKGSGDFAEVFLSSNTLTFGTEFPNAYQAKAKGKDGKRRTIKISKHDPQDPSSLKNLRQEHALLQKAGHLHVKEPIIVRQKDGSYISYMVMDEAPGLSLAEVIDQHQRRERPLKGPEILEICAVLLEALRAQVLAPGIVHRDLKPENIFIHLGPPMEASILDYGFAMLVDSPDKRALGSALFAAPETFSGASGMKSDVYSLARVIAEFLGVDLSQGGETYHAQTPNREETLDGIFYGIYDIKPEIKAAIKKTLVGMLALDPNKRFSLEEAQASFPFKLPLSRQLSACPYATFASQNSGPRSLPEEKPAAPAETIMTDWDEKIQKAYADYKLALEDNVLKKPWFGSACCGFANKARAHIKEADSWHLSYEALKIRISRIQETLPNKDAQREAIVKETGDFFKALCQYSISLNRRANSLKIQQCLFAFVGALIGASIGQTFTAFLGKNLDALIEALPSFSGELIGAVAKDASQGVEGALISAGLGAAIAGSLALYLMTPSSKVHKMAAQFLSELDAGRHDILRQAQTLP